MPIHALPKTPKRLRPGSVVVLGIPFDDNSSFMDGPASAPARIREVLHGGSANLCSETGVDLGDEPYFRDLGDLEFNNSQPPFQRIETAVRGLLTRHAHVLALGGDHSVTYPILRAYGDKYGALNLLHLDAHPDLYDEYQGNPHSNASPFARIMEERLAARLVQVGIRTLNPEQKLQARRFGVETFEMSTWGPEKIPIFEGPLYLSLDLDVLDPAFAPGVSHHEPGGLSTRDVLRIIQGLEGPVVGADIVEFNPNRDPVGITAMAAAKFLKEIAARMLETTK